MCVCQSLLPLRAFLDASSFIMGVFSSSHGQMRQLYPEISVSVLRLHQPRGFMSPCPVCVLKPQPLILTTTVYA